MMVLTRLLRWVCLRLAALLFGAAVLLGAFVMMPGVDSSAATYVTVVALALGAGLLWLAAHVVSWSRGKS